MPNLLLAVLLTCCLPAAAATTAQDCNPLCGLWQLEPESSDPLATALDSAFAKFKSPRPKRIDEGSDGNIRSMARADDEAAQGPVYERPLADELREAVTRTLTPPRTLELSVAGKDILVSIDGRKPVRLTPGAPHSRTDSEGTAEIEVAWAQGQLTVSETYDRKRRYIRRLALRPSDGVMVLTQQIVRPGLPEVTMRSIYRRPAIESAG
jgi:hypothetical protein